LLIVLIESVQGVENADGILAVEGIDGVIIGVGDLSLDMGNRGQFMAPAFLAAVQQIEGAARTRGKILGAKPYGDSSIASLLARGYRLIIVGRDVSLFRDSFATVLRLAKAASMPSEGR
jgi:2-keto-3-deoxy-L-rhamnonate aldolase RhmA